MEIDRRDDYDDGNSSGLDLNSCSSSPEVVESTPLAKRRSGWPSKRRRTEGNQTIATDLRNETASLSETFNHVGFNSYNTQPSPGFRFPGTERFLPSLGFSPGVFWKDSFFTPLRDLSVRDPRTRTLLDSAESDWGSPIKAVNDSKTTPSNIARFNGKAKANPLLFVTSASKNSRLNIQVSEDPFPTEDENIMENVERQSNCDPNEVESAEKKEPARASEKENQTPVNSQWLDFDIGSSQDAEMAQHLEIFEKGLIEGKTVNAKQDDEESTEKADSSKVEENQKGAQRASLSVSSQLQDFLEESDDPDLEADLLLAVCEIEKVHQEVGGRAEEPPASAVPPPLPAPPPSFKIGFATADGKPLAPATPEARDLAKKLWATCDSDPPPPAKDAEAGGTAASASPLFRGLRRGDVERTKEEKAGSSADGGKGVKFTGFKTGDGKELTFSQATYDKYLNIYNAPEEGTEERTPSPEMIAPVISVIPTPGFASLSTSSTSYLLKDPKLAKAAAIFGDIEGIEELLTQDAGPSKFPSASTSGTPSSSSRPFVPPSAAASTSGASTSKGGGGGVFDFSSSEFKDLNYGFLASLKDRKPVTSPLVRKPVVPVVQKVTPVNGRSSLVPGQMENTSTPRGLFRNSLNVRTNLTKEQRTPERKKSVASPAKMTKPQPESKPDEDEKEDVKNTSSEELIMSSPGFFKRLSEWEEEATAEKQRETGQATGKEGREEEKEEKEDPQGEPEEVVAASPVVSRRSGRTGMRKREEEREGEEADDVVMASPVVSKGGMKRKRRTQGSGCSGGSGAEKKRFYASVSASPAETQATLPMSPEESRSTLLMSPNETRSTLPMSPDETQATIVTSPAKPSNSSFTLSQLSISSDTTNIDLSMINKPPSPVVSFRRSAGQGQRPGPSTSADRDSDAGANTRARTRLHYTMADLNSLASSKDDRKESEVGSENKEEGSNKRKRSRSRKLGRRKKPKTGAEKMNCF